MKDLLLINIRARNKEVEDLLDSRKVEWLKGVTVRID